VKGASEVRSPGKLPAIALAIVILLLHVAPVRGELVLHWRFDESTGTTASDSAPDAGPDGGAFD
jgi:hypothetical protein